MIISRCFIYLPSLFRYGRLFVNPLCCQVAKYLENTKVDSNIFSRMVLVPFILPSSSFNIQYVRLRSWYLIWFANISRMVTNTKHVSIRPTFPKGALYIFFISIFTFDQTPFQRSMSCTFWVRICRRRAYYNDTMAVKWEVYFHYEGQKSISTFFMPLPNNSENTKIIRIWN